MKTVGKRRWEEGDVNLWPEPPVDASGTLQLAFPISHLGSALWSEAGWPVPTHQMCTSWDNSGAQTSGKGDAKVHFPPARIKRDSMLEPVPIACKRLIVKFSRNSIIIILVVCNWSLWEYLYHRHWQTLQCRTCPSYSWARSSIYLSFGLTVTL